MSFDESKAEVAEAEDDDLGDRLRKQFEDGLITEEEMNKNLQVLTDLPPSRSPLAGGSRVDGPPGARTMEENSTWIVASALGIWAFDNGPTDLSKAKQRNSREAPNDLWDSVASRPPSQATA